MTYTMRSVVKMLVVY